MGGGWRSVQRSEKEANNNLSRTVPGSKLCVRVCVFVVAGSKVRSKVGG